MIDPIPFNPNNQVNNKKKNYLVIIGVVLVAIVIIGGMLMSRQSMKTEKTADTVPEVTTEPSPTEKPTLNKSVPKIQVLNGTGTPGEAGIVVDALKEAGYDPDNIEVANAKNFNYTAAVIVTKDGFSDIANDLKDVLKSTFDEIIIDSIRLDSDNEFDVVITTGGKIFVEDTPTPTTTGSVEPTSDTEEEPTTTPTLTPSPTLSPTPTS